MCLLIWTVFSSERCGPWASCFFFLLSYFVCGLWLSPSCQHRQESKVSHITLNVTSSFNVWRPRRSCYHICEVWVMSSSQAKGERSLRYSSQEKRSGYFTFGFWRRGNVEWDHIYTIIITLLIHREIWWYLLHDWFFAEGTEAKKLSSRQKKRWINCLPPVYLKYMSQTFAMWIKKLKDRFLIF